MSETTLWWRRTGGTYNGGCDMATAFRQKPQPSSVDVLAVWQTLGDRVALPQPSGQYTTSTAGSSASTASRYATAILCMSA